MKEETVRAGNGGVVISLNGTTVGTAGLYTCSVRGKGEVAVKLFIEGEFKNKAKSPAVLQSGANEIVNDFEGGWSSV